MGELGLTILSLPNDILIIVLQGLSVAELRAVALSCRLLSALVSEFGWTGYLRDNMRPSYSLSKAQAQWSPRTRVKYNTLVDRSWSRGEFVARPLARPWQGKLQPVQAISPSRLVVAAGNVLFSYQFASYAADGEASSMLSEGSCNLMERGQRRRDITGLTFVADDGADRSLVIGFDDGTLELVFLKPYSKNGQAILAVERTLSGQLQIHSGDLVESLSSNGNALLSLSSSGIASLFDFESSAAPPSQIDLHRRSWVAHLAMRPSTPFAAFGTSSNTPLVVHAITNTELSYTPSAILHSDERDRAASTAVSTAVYGISSAPPSSPWGSSDQILVSGWYEGVVRVHDLRSSARTHLAGHRGPAPLLPVLSLTDPWSYEPIYSVSCGGGASSHVAAGSARHSVVCFWDVRFTELGWSVHAPGNDSSPVYSVILESSRLFGATQSRSFVYDFGPGVSSSTYPSLPIGPGVDGLKQKKGSNSVGYYVTKYSHNRTNH